MKKHFLIGLIIAVSLLFLLMVSLAQAAPPSFKGAGTTDASTSNCTVAWPTHASGDIALLFVESQSEEAVTAPTGFAAVAGSPKNTVTTQPDGTRLTVFWARAGASPMPDVTIADPGNHCIAQILTYQGVVTTGDPWDVTGGGADDGPPVDTSVSATGVTTTVTDTLIVVAVAQGRDANSTSTFSGWSNVNLTGIAERADFARNNGDGGGFGVMDGVKATAGATGNTTATLSDAFRNAFLTIALKPPPPAGTPNKLAFLQQPTDATAGVAISPNVTVEIQNSSGIRVDDNTTQVAISIGSNPGGGTLTGDSLTVTAVAGVATFSNLKIDQGGNGYTLIATAASLPNPTTTSNSFNIRGPSKLAFLVQPSNTIYNQTISPAVTVEIQDSLGNLVPIATNTVTIAIGNNPGGGTLSGPTTFSAVAGVATFSSLSINNEGVGYTLTASASGLTGATSSPFNITTGAYGLTQCMADRFGDDFTGGACKANDVQITSLSLVDASTTSCIGGEIIILDLRAQLSFGMSTRFDIGVFIANDGKSLRYRSTNAPPNNGAASCTVSILPTSGSFFNEDGDACGDVKDGGTPYHYIYGVPVLCQADPTSNGNLYIPYGTSWELSSGNDVCTSAANPSPDNTAKCNIPDVASTTVSVVVLPRVTKIRNQTTPTPGQSFTYTVTITNNTGTTLSGWRFTDPDPADPNLTISSATCTYIGYPATVGCSASYTSGELAAGINLPDMPVNTAQSITNITQANPAVVTYSGADTIATGDRVSITGVRGMTQLNNGEFTVVRVSANTIELSGINSTDYTAYTAGSGTITELSSLTFVITATNTNPTGAFSNTAKVTQISNPTNSASATDTFGGSRVKIIKWREVFK